MTSDKRAPLVCATVILGAILWTPSSAAAQQPAPRPPAATGSRIGLDLFGGAGVSWPAAQDSFEAVGLGSEVFELGGGARVTGLWRELFAQVAASHWSDSGERAFVAADGTVFPLGIPLDVSATFVDATIGMKNTSYKSSGQISFVSFVGAGAGVVQYRESSPFAEPGDDLETTKPSYHALVGFEVPVVGPLGVVASGLYRFVPGVLGDGGASEALDEDLLSGFQLFVGLRVGFGGPRAAARPPSPVPPAGETPAQEPGPVTGIPVFGTINRTAPVFLLPDETRTPLRSLAAGTRVRILQEEGDWVRIQFTDNQYGPRVGYVQRRFVLVRQAP